MLRRRSIHLKTPGEIDAMAAAGELSAKALRMVGKAAVAGVSTLELDEIAETVIREGGGVPAFKGYGGFPGTICASVNDEIVHGIPSAHRVLKEGDIISVDTGAIVDGWVGDNAWTYAVGSIDPAVADLLAVTEQSMWAGIDAARVGNRLGDIGHGVQSVAERAGYGVVREYAGHGVGHSMHEDPTVLNYGRPHSGLALKAGMVLAIEPMVTLGTYRTILEPDGWLVRTKDGKPAAHFEKTIAITEDGPLILTKEEGCPKPI